MKCTFLTSVFFLLLLSSPLIGQDAPPEDNPSAKGEEAKKAAEEEETPRPKVGTMITEWPEAWVGFSESEAMISFRELLQKADFKKFKPRNRKYLRRVTKEDMQVKDYEERHKIRASADAYREIQNFLPKGHQVALDVPKELPADWELSDFDGLHFGTLYTGRKKGHPRFVEGKDPALATAYWFEFVRTDPLGRESRTYVQVLDRAKRNDPMTAWRFHYRDCAQLLKKKLLGEHGTWQLFELLNPVSFKERSIVAHIASQLFSKVAYKWWDLGAFIQTARDERMLNTWAFSHFHQYDVPDSKRLTYLFCYAFEAGVPAEDVVMIDKVYLTKKMAKVRRERAAASKYAGIFKKTTISSFKLSSLKSRFRSKYRKLEKATRPKK